MAKSTMPKREARKKRARKAAGLDGDADPRMATWRDEVAFFESVRAELLRNDRYTGKSVAIRRREVVDSDADKFKLVRRVARRYPGEVVFVAKVEPADRVVSMPSPQFSR